MFETFYILILRRVNQLAGLSENKNPALLLQFSGTVVINNMSGNIVFSRHIISPVDLLWFCFINFIFPKGKILILPHELLSHENNNTLICILTRKEKE